MRVTSLPSRSRTQFTSAPRPKKTSAATSSTSCVMPPSCLAGSPDDGRAGGRGGAVVDVPAAEEPSERERGRLLAGERDPGRVRREACVDVHAAPAGVARQVGHEHVLHVAEPKGVAGANTVLAVKV